MAPRLWAKLISNHSKPKAHRVIKKLTRRNLSLTRFIYGILYPGTGRLRKRRKLRIFTFFPLIPGDKAGMFLL
jgi:hypothetical protein